MPTMAMIIVFPAPDKKEAPYAGADTWIRPQKVSGSIFFSPISLDFISKTVCEISCKVNLTNAGMIFKQTQMQRNHCNLL